jgi:hypothetical protein
MTGKTVTREHLYDAVYRAAGLSRAEAAALVELVLEEIASCLERGEARQTLCLRVVHRSPEISAHGPQSQDREVCAHSARPGCGFQAVRGFETAHQPSILMEAFAPPVSVARTARADGRMPDARADGERTIPSGSASTA